MPPAREAMPERAFTIESTSPSAVDARPRSVTPALVAELEALVGVAHVLREGDEAMHFGADRCRGSWPVAPGLVVLPRSAEEVRGVVRACARAGVPMVPSGGRTGLAGGATATAGEVVVSLGRMHRIDPVDVDGRSVRCEAGATVQAVQEAAAAVGLLYPVDFASKGTAEVGGSISTNAGGLKVVRYGHTRAWVAGIDVVVASGDLLSLGGPLVKDNTGYDLTQLFIGAEGTLGIVVGATLRLFEQPDGHVVVLCSASSDVAMVPLFRAFGRAGLRVSAFECFDAGCLHHVLVHRGRTGAGPFAGSSPWCVLVEVEVVGREPQAGEGIRERVLDVLTQAQEEGLVVDAVLAETGAREREFWAYREDISEALHRFRPHKADIAVPLPELAGFADAWRSLALAEVPGSEPLVFGHVGDGNLHLNLVPPPELAAEDFAKACKALDERTFTLVQKRHGTISAEHGVGLLKRPYLHFRRSPEEIAMMRAIKRALDPAGLMNPGKIFALEDPA